MQIQIDPIGSFQCIHHASYGAFGSPEKGNHREIHHHQLLQSLYDLNSRDTLYLQLLMDEICEKYQVKEKIIIKMTKERVQRWLVNQRHAKWLLKTMSITVPNTDTSILLLWAIEVHSRFTGLKRTIAEDIMKMIEVPDIILALNYEAELGNYFEVTTKWHNHPGDFSIRVGFRMLEYSQLVFEYIRPWWTVANKSPKDCFPHTMAYLHNHFKAGEERNKRMLQIVNGINSGYTEMIKMVEQMLSPPFVFLSLLIPHGGPHLMKAILHVLSGMNEEVQVLREKVIEQINVGESKVASWITILEEKKDDLLSFFKSYGFVSNTPGLLQDIKSFCMFDYMYKVDGKNYEIKDLKKKFPVIFDLLWAKFVCLPSSSRIAEQMHSIL